MSAFDLVFEAPDVGLWVNDRVHFFRPETQLAARVRERALDGQALSIDRYGQLAARPDRASVNRFAYGRMGVVLPRPEGNETSARTAWVAAAAADPVVSARLATSDRVWVDRIWRDDVISWDADRKPAALKRTRELAAVDVATLGDGPLLEHLDACTRHLGDMVSLHHEFNGTWQVPLGDYLAGAREWTGLSPTTLMGALDGASPVSTGHVPELDVLTAAIAEDTSAAALLSSAADPGELLAALRAREGRIGEAARAYIDLVGYRSIGGFDPMDEYALEHPLGLVESIRAALDGKSAAGDGAGVIEEVRATVPAAHRDDFDALLAEARLTFRVKDERGIFANTPVAGLVKHAVLEVGRRLADRGVIAAPSHATEGSIDELTTLLDGRGDDTLAADLADRHSFRSRYTSNDAPATLGRPHQVPPPNEWLPEAAARLARANEAVAAAVRTAEGADEPSSKTVLRGSGVSRGSYTGPARLVLNPGDIQRVGPGDVLVAIATNPGYSAVMSICGAIVTDAGGPLSHAAIVARELGVPAVVGTGTATTSIPEGAMVTVDGASGEVHISV